MHRLILTATLMLYNLRTSGGSRMRGSSTVLRVTRHILRMYSGGVGIVTPNSATPAQTVTGLIHEHSFPKEPNLSSVTSKTVIGTVRIPGMLDIVESSSPTTSGTRSLPTAEPRSSTASTVPDPTEEDVSSLLAFLRHKKNVITITGAGVSTGSGIPDYRGPAGSYRNGHKPMSHQVIWPYPGQQAHHSICLKTSIFFSVDQEFVGSEAHRQRYWARSMVAWHRFSLAQPNSAHLALAQLETSRRMIGGIITQVESNLTLLCIGPHSN